MPRPFALVVSIAFAALVAWAACRSPAPAPASMRADRFSAGRAMVDVTAIGSMAHPMGSVQHGRVFDDLVRRFQSLGLQVRVQQGRSYERSVYRGEAFIEGGEVRNIVAVLPGRSPAEPALAIMAHYDSVPSSPGAADDTVGVASALEIARALRANQPARDIVFLITDGEEAGLLGARSFFAEDPLARRIGAVLNMESRGGGGRVYMFETGPADGAMIDLFARTAVNPTASSLAGYVYAHMPNDTDFSVSKRLGLPGFNYAFIGRPFDYHAASSTPAALDQGSLQHMGDQVLAAARALAMAPTLPGKRPDVVYADILGGPVIVYPIWAGWLVLLAAAVIAGVGLRKVFKTEPFRWRDALRGAGGLLAVLIVCGLVMALVRIGVGVPSGFLEERPLLAQFEVYEAALAAAGLAAAILALNGARLGGGRFWGAWAGALGLGLVFGVALQLAAPLTAFLVSWPLLAASINVAVIVLACRGRRRSRKALGVSIAFGALVLAELIYFAHAVALGVGADLPEVLAVFVMIAALAMFPLLWPGSGELWTLVLGAGALALTVALTLIVRSSDPTSPRYPRPTSALYVADLDGNRYFRATPMAQLDGWTASVLGADGGGIVRSALPPLFEHGHLAPARPIAADKSRVSINRLPDGRLQISLPPSGHARQLRLDLRMSKAITTATVNGQGAEFSPMQGAWTHIVWNAPSPAGLVVTLSGSGPIEARWAEVIDGWPAEAVPLPRRPANAMPWQTSDATVIIGSSRGG